MGELSGTRASVTQGQTALPNIETGLFSSQSSGVHECPKSPGCTWNAPSPHAVPGGCSPEVPGAVLVQGLHDGPREPRRSLMGRQLWEGDGSGGARGKVSQKIHGTVAAIGAVLTGY